MASINYATREISCKFVYYGPGLSGKTTNLQIIHRKIPDKDKSEMVSLATETDRTLFFDFLPLDLGSIKGFSTKFQLYTVPGQVYYNATRKLVLRGVDGVVFVVDSQVDKLQENLESFANLQENLREYGHAIESIPLVLQYNKRDLPNVYPLDQLNSLVNKNNHPYYEAVASTGVGVFTTLKAIGKSVIDKFNAKYAGFQGTRRPTRPEAPGTPSAGQPGRPGQPQAFGAAPPYEAQRPAGQPYPGGSFGAGPASPGGHAGGPGAQSSRSPLNVPGPAGFAAPQPGFGGFPPPSQNPFPGNPPLPGFPNPTGGFPAQAPGPGNFPPRPQQPAPITGPAPTAGPGFGMGNPGGFGSPPGFPSSGFGGGNTPNPFAGGPGPLSGSPGGPVGQNPGGPFPGGQNPAGPFPGRPAAPSQPPGHPGFAAPPNIPVSPFVESFTGGKPPAPNAPQGIPGMAPPMNNPFSPGGAPPAFGQNRPGPSPEGAGPFGGPGVPGGTSGQPTLRPGQFGQAPMGGQPGQNPAMGQPMGGFPAYPGAPGNAPGPFPGGAGQFPFGGSGNAPENVPPPGFPPQQGQAAGPFPILTPGSGPGQPFPDQPPNMAPPFGKNLGGMNDNSGIVTTYEDMAKDESFKTRKLPHPGEKKKGFFDGLFNKEK